MIITVTATSALGFGAIISMAAVVTLIVFLATRELASAGRSRFSLRIARFASVGILPLAIAFAVMVAIQIAQVL